MAADREVAWQERLRLVVCFLGKRPCARTLRRFQGKACGESATDANLVGGKNESSFRPNSHLGLYLRVKQERKQNWCQRLVGEGVQRKGVRKVMFKVSFEETEETILLKYKHNISKYIHRCLVTL